MAKSHYEGGATDRGESYQVQGAVHSAHGYQKASSSPVAVGNSEHVGSKPTLPTPHSSNVWRWSEEWEPSGDTIWGAEKILQETNRASVSVVRSVESGSTIEVQMVKSIVGMVVRNALKNDRKIIVLNRIERGDECPFMHTVNVALLTISFLNYLHHEPTVIEEVGVGALLHDIGKARVPDTPLCKREELTGDEVGIIKECLRHTKTVLSSIMGISPLQALVAFQHHERYNGTGYPYGLKGDEISIYSQALSIVDMYDAITSCQCYSKSENSREALRRIERLRGVNFSEHLVNLFAGWIGSYLATSVKAPMGRTVTVMIGPDYTGQYGMMAPNDS
ncbi:MAG: HD domain-containing protein [Deltaproteobacteria bacterium]|nr:HD domain-containing protein [Deltaproteobacteria bacterium]